MPVGAGVDAFNDETMPLETVEGDGYGAGPDSEGIDSVVGTGVKVEDSVPGFLGPGEFVKEQVREVEELDVSLPTPEASVLKMPPVPPVLGSIVAPTDVLMAGAGVVIAPEPSRIVPPEVPAPEIADVITPPVL